MKKRKIGKDELKNVGQNQERLLEKNNPIRIAARKLKKKSKTEYDNQHVANAKFSKEAHNRFHKAVNKNDLPDFKATILLLKAIIILKQLKNNN